MTRVAGGLVIVAGLALALARFFCEPPPARGLESALGAVAFGAVVAAPGVLALLASHDRPALLLPAAMLLIPLSFISFALVTLPLLIPAYLLVAAYTRTAPADTGGRTAAITAGVLLLLLAAGLSLFAHQDPREWTTPTAGYGTSDIVTWAESLISLALSTSAVAAGWYCAGPPRRSIAHS
jgi:hypothetical protein